MTDSDKIVMARAIKDAGGAIYGQVPTAGGWQTVEVEPSDLPIFLNNLRSWIAKVCGVTDADLEEYEINERIPRCGGTTKAGRRCRNTLAYDSGPADFVRLHGTMCAVHS